MPTNIQLRMDDPSQGQPTTGVADVEQHHCRLEIPQQPESPGEVAGMVDARYRARSVDLDDDNADDDPRKEQQPDSEAARHGDTASVHELHRHRHGRDEGHPLGDPEHPPHGERDEHHGERPAWTEPPTVSWPWAQLAWARSRRHAHRLQRLLCGRPPQPPRSDRPSDELQSKSPPAAYVLDQVDVESLPDHRLIWGFDGRRGRIWGFPHLPAMSCGVIAAQPSCGGVSDVGGQGCLCRVVRPCSQLVASRPSCSPKRREASDDGRLTRERAAGGRGTAPRWVAPSPRPSSGSPAGGAHIVWLGAG